MQVRFSLFRVGLTLALAALATSAHACRCVEPVPPASAYRHASAVVKARVVDVQVNAAEQSATARLTVSQHWKRGTAAEIDVFTDSNCAYPFEVGREYVLFLLKDRPLPGYVSARCMGNQPVEGTRADAVLRWLRQRGEVKSAVPAQ